MALACQRPCMSGLIGHAWAASVFWRGFQRWPLTAGFSGSGLLFDVFAMQCSASECTYRYVFFPNDSKASRAFVNNRHGGKTLLTHSVVRSGVLPGSEVKHTCTQTTTALLVFQRCCRVWRDRWITLINLKNQIQAPLWRNAKSRHRPERKEGDQGKSNVCFTSHVLETLQLRQQQQLYAVDSAAKAPVALHQSYVLQTRAMHESHAVANVKSTFPPAAGKTDRDMKTFSKRNR